MMRNMKGFLLSTILLLLLPFSAFAQEEKAAGPIKQGDVLTLNRCIEIALQQQPAVTAARYNIKASENRVGEAQSAYFPQINIQGQYSRIKPFPTSSTAPSIDAYNQYLGTASLSQTIFDFGKTPAQVKIQKLNMEATRSDFDTQRSQTVLTVKQAYYGVLQAQRNLDVAKETIAQFSQHLDQAKGFFEVGTRPKFDVTKAEVDLSNSRLNLINAENALRIARVNLNNAMGLPDAPEYSIEDNISYLKQEVSLDQAIASALKNRPELVANEFRVRAAEKNIDLAKTGYYPVVTGNAAYTKGSYVAPTFREDGWNAGVVVTFPLFNGFLTRHQVQESTANYNAAKANEDLLKQNIILEVQQAFLNLRAAADRVPTAELGVRQATENLDIATGRYNEGVGNPIEVTDAQVLYTNAKTSYTQALYDYNIAAANLDKAMGAIWVK